MIVEAILVTGLTLAVFCLGVAVGAIVEHRYGPTRSSQESQNTFSDSDAIPLDISLAQQLIESRPTENATPLDWSIHDPDVTLELPIYEPDSSKIL